MKIHWNRRVLLILSISLVFIILIYLALIRENILKSPNFQSDVSSEHIYRLEINNSLWLYRQNRYKLYQANQYSRSGVGENGASVSLTAEEQKNLLKVIKKEAFNRPLSDRVALERSLPDFRSTSCQNVQYPLDLPTLSVIVIFHNEAWSSLLRTVFSVVNRTPPHLLKEVVLLDDASYSLHLGSKLDEFVNNTWPDTIVRIVRSSVRLGLIKARLMGAKAATGNVINFLDSHCEVTMGWAEPLLYRIYQKKETMMIPVIESIDATNLAYYGSTELGMVGTFWWSMHFTWQGVPEHFKLPNAKPTDPIKSATMAGGLFAVDREYFFSIGGYDEGMEIWGGENLEISFRTWMCGGTLESSPCSHVGHIFRATHPYTFPGNKDYHGLNSKRLVDVWLDDYQRIFYLHRPDLKKADCGNIESRKKLRKQLNCKPFSWYLENVTPEKFIPDVNVYGYGYFQNPETGFCLDLLNQNEFDRGNLMTGVYSCQNGLSGAQIFSFYPQSKDGLSNNNVNKNLSLSARPKNVIGQIRREWGCMTATKHYGPISFVNCQSQWDTQLWVYLSETKLIRNLKFNQCLDTKNIKLSSPIVLGDCQNNSNFQKWTIQHIL